MKRRTIFVTLFFLCVTISHAQKKLFQEAINAGRQPTMFYVMVNDKNKMIRLDDIQEFAKENGYILGEHTNKDVNRFGDIDQSVATIEFLPVDEYESYIFANLFPEQSSILATKPSQGSAFFFNGYSDSNKPLVHYDAITWHGTVSNGTVQGKGVGYIKKANNIIFTLGEYVNGFPVGIIKTITFDTKGNYARFQHGNAIEMSVDIGKMSEGMASINKDGIYGFVSNDGNIVIPPKFPKIVSDFSNGKAIVIDNDKEIVIDNSGTYIGISDRQKQINADADEICKQAIAIAEGDGVTRNTIQSVELFKKAAEMGNAEAQFRLGRCYYESGEGVNTDLEKARFWLEKSIRQVNPKAGYLLCILLKETGVVDVEGKFYNAVFHDCKDLAEQGDVEGQFYLGLCYSSGTGTNRDEAQAIEWYRKAAEQGLARAQCNLGDCYESGNGVTQNYKEAVRWYRLAAEQGFARAQFNLGWCYQSGNGVTQNYEEAVRWYRLAAEQGFANAQFNLGWCYGTGNGVTQNYKEAVRWYRLAAEQGFAEAQCNLGWCYESGNGVTQNYEEAVRWYRLAAEQGRAQAQCNLGWCYGTGNGVTQNYKEAVRWYRLAAEQGFARAQCNLGWCYEYGNGVTQNYEEAVRWYRLAAEQGLAQAQFNLGLCYRNGLGVLKNTTKSIEWFQKAAAQGHKDAINAIDEIKNANARKKKLAEFSRRLGYNPEGTTIAKLVSVGRSTSAVIDYINNYNVGGYSWFVNIYIDYGKNYKVYKLYWVSDRWSGRGTYAATIHSQNGKITSVIWK